MKSSRTYPVFNGLIHQAMSRQCLSFADSRRAQSRRRVRFASLFLWLDMIRKRQEPIAFVVVVVVVALN
jgi:hypothetical protein